MSGVRRLVTVDIDLLTLPDLERFCATARRDGATDRDVVLLVEVAPFIKRHRLQIICPPNTPKDTQ